MHAPTAPPEEGPQTFNSRFPTGKNLYTRKAAFLALRRAISPVDVKLGGLTGDIQVRLACYLASELIPS